MPPQPRRTSKLSGQHPADPSPQQESDQPSVADDASRAYARTREHAHERTRALADARPGEREHAGTPDRESAGAGERADAGTPDRGNARTGEREHARPGEPANADTPERADERAGEPAGEGDEARRAHQWKRQKDAREAGWAWGAAVAKARKRQTPWVTAVEDARAAGVPATVLREQIGEAANKAGIPPGQVPTSVWLAAGLEPPPD